MTDFALYLSIFDFFSRKVSNLGSKVSSLVILIHRFPPTNGGEIDNVSVHLIKQQNFRFSGIEMDLIHTKVKIHLGGAKFDVSCSLNE